ncbi:MAG: hypothetical protein RH917_01070 [Lacipirellulaceae bacterium]
MAVSHETGHLLGGWIGGSTLLKCDLAPWRLPYSIHNPDPNPALTLWSGPLVGVGLPALLAFAIGRWWTWFIADFCILANGTYLALAALSGDPLLDTPRMIAAGIHPTWIASFCLITISVGYFRFRRDILTVLKGKRLSDLPKH